LGAITGHWWEDFKVIRESLSQIEKVGRIEEAVGGQREDFGIAI